VRRAAWLVPDVALVAAAVTLFFCLFLSHGYRELFRDADAGWHIRAGERMLATGTLPRTDPYSFTRRGEPWFAWEWMADMAAGAAHRLGGLPAVALLYAALIAAGVWLWFRLHWAMGGDFLIACAMSPLLLTTCGIHWLARPHVMGWLFALAALLLAERPARRFGAREALGLAVFTALWANVHASFFLAPAIALTYAAGRSRARAFFLKAALIAALAPLANPHGWKLWTHVAGYLTDTALLDRIGEFQSFDFHTPGAWQIVAVVILGMMGGALEMFRRPERFLLAVWVTVLALRSARGLPLDALLLLPVAGAALAGSLPWAGFLEYSRRLRAIDARMSGLALVPLLLLAAWAPLRIAAVAAQTGFPPDRFPVAAWPHIPANARLFAPDKFGGYLIYRSAGAFPVFFDGRSDLYGAAFLRDYGRMMQVRPGWQALWDRYRFTHALLPEDAPLIPALQQAGWRIIWRDRTATLLEKAGT
jgi:hypothetical protein